MSAKCQKQTFCAAVKNVVIRSPRQRWRAAKLERSTQVPRCLNGKVGRLLAAQNTIDVGCRASPCSDRVEAVGEQTALGCENSGEIDCRQAMPRRQYDDRSTICRCFGMW